MKNECQAAEQAEEQSNYDPFFKCVTFSYELHILIHCAQSLSENNTFYPEISQPSLFSTIFGPFLALSLLLLHHKKRGERSCSPYYNGNCSERQHKESLLHYDVHRAGYFIFLEMLHQDCLLSLLIILWIYPCRKEEADRLNQNILFSHESIVHLNRKLKSALI